MGIVSTASTTNGPRGTPSSPSSTRPTPTAHRTPPISYTTASTSNPPLFTVVQGLDTFAGAGGVDSSRLLDQLRRRATEGSGVGRQWAKARLWAIGVVESKVHVLGWIDSSTCVACVLSLSSPSLLLVSGASLSPTTVPSRPTVTTTHHLYSMLLGTRRSPVLASRVFSSPLLFTRRNSAGS